MFFSCVLKAQFIAIMVHAFQLLFIDCDYPKAFVWWIGCHGVLFFGLFSDFYKRSYKGGKVLLPLFSPLNRRWATADGT